MPVGITVWRVRIGMFNSVSHFVINGQSVSSELLKSALLLLIHCYRIIIILFATPLTLVIESLLVIAESAFFLLLALSELNRIIHPVLKLSIVVSTHSCWQVSVLSHRLHRFFIANANSLQVYVPQKNMVPQNIQRY